MIGCLTRRRLSLCIRDGRRFQPFQLTHHMQRPREYKDSLDARNLLPEHRKMVEDNDWRALTKERTKQGRHSDAQVWPTYENGEWKYHSTPILPNFVPLPGRVTDNQQRWLQETVILCPWYKELYEEWVAGRQDMEQTEQKLLEEAAVKKLCSSAYSARYKKTLLKIMAMPLMEHEGDIFNDGVRVAALTIDIR